MLFTAQREDFIFSNAVVSIQQLISHDGERSTADFSALD